MRRSPSVALSIFSVIVMAGVTTSGAVQAAPSPTTTPTSALAPSSDLEATGFVAGGERTVESSHPVVFVFTLKNKGPDAIDSSADLSYAEVQNGTVTDQLCIFPDRRSFNADSPFCEFGQLKVGQVARMTLIVQPFNNVTGVRLSVRVCSSNESGIPDPVSANDCRTLGVRY
jgi:hypothetical protein